jgi:hypothetical protein
VLRFEAKPAEKVSRGGSGIGCVMRFGFLGFIGPLFGEYGLAWSLVPCYGRTALRNWVEGEKPDG